MLQYFFGIHGFQVERFGMIHVLVNQMTNNLVGSSAKLSNQVTLRLLQYVEKEVEVGFIGGEDPRNL